MQPFNLLAMQTMKYIALITFLFSCTGLIRAQDSVPSENKLLELYQAQKYREAAEYIKRFYPDTIRDRTVLDRLAYCYRMSGDHQQAAQYYLKLYALDSLDIAVLANLATVHAQRGLLRAATNYYQKLIRLDSNYIPALTALSTIMTKLGETDAAYRYLERANALAPMNSDIAFDFAQLCLKLRNDDDGYRHADSILQTALQTDPENGLLLLAKAQTAEKLRNYSELVQRCEHLVEQGEETSQVLTLLAKGYFHIDDFGNCRDTYQHALDRYGPISELDYYYLAMAYRALKQYQAGLACMDKVLELAVSANTALYYGRKADLHDLANQPSAAAASYLRSFQFEKIPLHYYSLAVLYDRKLSDPRNALRYYRLYLKQRPGKEESDFVEYVQKRIKELE